ncbi:MAG: zinc ABC transporter substrate-binding protein [Anaerolineae bacterium]|nr:zinc ABC transporter substrate-binding protein [Anaerolineae bacterium]
MFTRPILALLFLLMCVPVISAQDAPAPVEIVTTTTQASDLVRVLLAEVPADAVTVTALMGAGVDPHLYKPTESDIAAMSRADAVIYSGLHLEGQFDAVFEALAERGVTIYAIATPVKEQGFTLGGFDLSEELVNVDDPHFWFDPRNWELSALATAEVLAELLPDHAEVITATAEAYALDLQAVYAWSLEAMATVPEDQRVLVTSHDAFNYFGDAVGWEVRGLQGLSTADEAGVADIQAVAAFVADRGIPVLFVESSVPPQALNAVREAVVANGGAVEIAPYTLYSDAMDAPETFGGTYIGMYASNVAFIVTAFGQALPDWPEDLLPELPEDLLTVETPEE